MKTVDVAAGSLRNELPRSVSMEIPRSSAKHAGQIAHEPSLASEPFVERGRLLLDTGACRAFWNRRDVGLTFGQYKVVQLLVAQPGIHVTYRAIHDHMRGEGFLAGRGPNGYQVNVRNAIKNIRKKFCACDPTFDEIRTFCGFGYCWREAAGSQVT